MDEIRRNYVIGENTPIAEIAELFPSIGEYLTAEYGFHCIGCPLSYSETLGEGIIVHGLDEGSKEQIIEKLNEMVHEIVKGSA